MSQWGEYNSGGRFEHRFISFQDFKIFIHQNTEQRFIKDEERFYNSEELSQQQPFYPPSQQLAGKHYNYTTIVDVTKSSVYLLATVQKSTDSRDNFPYFEQAQRRGQKSIDFISSATLVF